MKNYKVNCYFKGFKETVEKESDLDRKIVEKLVKGYIILKYQEGMKLKPKDVQVYSILMGV